MAIQTIKRNNAYFSPQATDEINVIIESIENKINNTADVIDIETQSLRFLSIPGTYNNASYLRENHVLVLSFSVKSISDIDIPVDVSGEYCINATTDDGASVPCYIRKHTIHFPADNIEGNINIRSVIVV